MKILKISLYVAVVALAIKSIILIIMVTRNCTPSIQQALAQKGYSKIALERTHEECCCSKPFQNRQYNFTAIQNGKQKKGKICVELNIFEEVISISEE